MNKDIKFIYFDVGGVAILDFSKTNKWQEMIQALGINESNRNRFNEILEEFESEICVNKKDLNDFVKVVKSELELSLPEDYSMLNDLVDRFEANVSINPILNKLSQQFKLGLLTNMYPGMLDKIKERGILPSIEWKVIIDSSIVGFKKPQNDIYKLAENKSGVKPENIFFIDNLIVNIDAAKKRSWQTLLYDPSNISDSNKKLEIRLGIKRKNQR